MQGHFKACLEFEAGVGKRMRYNDTYTLAIRTFAVRTNST